MNNLNIIGLQHNIIWQNKNENLKIIESLLPKKKPDIFLLPEMFATGFSMEIKDIIDYDMQILNWMKSIAIKYEMAIGGSIAIAENNKHYNRFYFIEKTGKTHHYNKRHLFSLAKEDEYFTKGTEKIIIDYLGWKICPQVCYDLRFPVFQRNTEGYDLMINIANWPKKRITAWDTLLKARAIENQVYVFGLNRTGIDANNLEYSGSSQCYFADGSIAGTLKNNYLESTLNLRKLRIFREQFSVLKDSDDFEIKL